MKLMRLAMCVAVFAVVGGFALSEDLDVRALQAKLAEQEARLNDLQAKMGSGSASAYGMGADVGNVAPEMPGAILSAKKNGVVKIGGTINTRYFYRNYTVDDYAGRSTPTVDASGDSWGAVGANYATDSVYYGSNFVADEKAYTVGKDGIVYDSKGDWIGDAAQTQFDAGAYGNGFTKVGNLNNNYDDTGSKPYYGRLANYRSGDFKISDAKVNFKIDVNDFFDAYLELNLQDGDDSVRANVAQKAWVRWKNVCNSGFGVLVGRGDLPAGPMGKGAGSVITNWTGGGSGDHGDGTTTLGSYMVPRIGWDYSRTTMINPYWESKDGKYKFDFALFEAIDMRYPREFWGSYQSGETTNYRTINYGLGSFAVRLKASPIEGLNLYASYVNAYNQWADEGKDWTHTSKFGKWGSWRDEGFNHYNKNNGALDLAFDYTPAAFNRLKIYAQWLHNWNGGWIDDYDSDVFNYGFKFAINEQLSFFAEGDYMKASVGDGNYNTSGGGLAFTKKQTGWASYIGFQYNLPYGVNAEVGWRHEDVKNKDRQGNTNYHLKGDVIYGHLGFNF